jgi:glycosyltransferase involved in cell wall biosynthesis
MKLLLVTDTYPPDVNGVARTLHTLAGALRRRGHEVLVVTTLGTTEPEPVPRRVMPSLPLPGYPGLRVGWATRATMRECLETFAADVLYVATETALGWAAIRAANQLGLPVISGFHTNFQSYLENYRLPGFESVAKRLLCAMHNRTQRTLTPSEDTAETLRSWGMANVGVLGRGVDTALFDPAKRDEALRRSWGAGPEAPVALYVGRLAAEKNLPLAAAAFRAMKACEPNLVGVFVGAGPKGKWLEAAYPEFVFAGARVGADLARHYASADVFVFPSATETFGNVVLEAMASGLVVVAFDYAAPRLLIREGVNGWLVPLGEEKAFVEKAVTVCRGAMEANLRAAARAAALEHSWDRVIEQFENELLSAMSLSVAPSA